MSESNKSTIRSLGRVADNLEQSFLAGMETNIPPVLGSGELPGRTAKLQRRDGAAALREEMFKRGLGDPDVFSDLPLSRSLTWTLETPRFRWWPWFFHKTGSVLTAAVWHDLDGLLQGQPARPATGDEIRKLARDLLPDTPAPKVLVVCSPSGFGDDVRQGLSDLSEVKLILVEPDRQRTGSWRVTPAGAEVSSTLLQAFDPETGAAKVQRIREAVRAESAQLITGGLSARRLAERLNVPAALVSSVFRQMPAREHDLRPVSMGDDVILVRGLAGEMEGSSMWDWLKRLLGSRETPTAKINVLKERRAVLSAQRDRMYDDIAQLETREKELKAQGVATESDIVRRRVAGQLAGVRKDIARQNASVSLLAAQIEQISTHLHNLELEQQGQVAGLPTTEEMQEQAARAEQLFADVAAKRDLAGAFDVGLDAALTSPEEADILKEFEAARADKIEKLEEKTEKIIPEKTIVEPAVQAPAKKEDIITNKQEA